jgi:hypothetical protein
MKVLNDIACILNWVQIYLKKHGMKIGEKGIENLLWIWY